MKRNQGPRVAKVRRSWKWKSGLVTEWRRGEWMCPRRNRGKGAGRGPSHEYIRAMDGIIGATADKAMHRGRCSRHSQKGTEGVERYIERIGRTKSRIIHVSIAVRYGGSTENQDIVVMRGIVVSVR